MNLLRSNPADRQLIGKPELTLLGIAALCISAVQYLVGKRNDAVGPILAPEEVEHHLAMAYAQGESDGRAVVVGDPSDFGLQRIPDWTPPADELEQLPGNELVVDPVAPDPEP